MYVHVLKVENFAIYCVNERTQPSADWLIGRKTHLISSERKTFLTLLVFELLIVLSLLILITRVPLCPLMFCILVSTILNLINNFLRQLSFFMIFLAVLYKCVLFPE